MVYKTSYSRKIDSTGRLIIPAKLRSQFGIEATQEYEFFLIKDEGESYLGIKIPTPDEKTLVEDAKKILRDRGYEILG